MAHRHRYRDAHRLRILLAQECARLIADEGILDFRTAKRKAALRLAIADKALLPDNREIEKALVDHQQLFYADHQALWLQDLRETAVEAMRFLAHFRPRLVGSVLSGTASPNADIQLHLFTDAPQEVALFLIEHRIPFEAADRRLRFSNGDLTCLPVFRFSSGNHGLDLTVFTLLAAREAPRSPVDGRPMRRASLVEVQALLGEDLV
ncbi:MAG: hypothetical protein H6974_08015 [Gammaproteobacteria bacterium]|nr:hypothetical protein [Gammaproteobacteria bacterium]MCP5196716.1 hypothetical protein [Gammaproteobacteria bacterium]